MKLILDEDQQLLAKTARQFAAASTPVSRLRALRDADDPVGLSRETWREMAELGWTGINLPEAYGGLDLGFAELAVVLEALGAELAPEPFLSTVLLAGQALRLGGTEAQQGAWLPRIAAGDAVLALAHQEPGARYCVHHVATRAEPDGAGGFTLSGDKHQVLDATGADALLIPARTRGETRDRDGVTLFLVPADAAGLTIVRQRRVDSRSAALVHLDGVEAGPGAVVGTLHEATPLLEEVVDRATVGLCAEMVGAMGRAFELTLAYLKERKQFGVPIGSFQALKHRAAYAFVELSLARAAVMAASRTLDEAPERAPALISLAKARCSEAYLHLAHEGVQMFGGVGMTDEVDIGLYLKRARAAELTFGDAAWHRDRWARLAGY